MNKQIEAMAKVIQNTYLPINQGNVTVGETRLYSRDAHQLAENLYNAGYRKVSQEGAECPTCHGTGRIGTTDWLTKNISKEQLAKEKAEAVAEHEAQLKRDVAREIFADLEKARIATKVVWHGLVLYDTSEKYAEIKKKHGG